MNIRRLSLTATILLAPLSLGAQRDAGTPPASAKAPREASQYDFLEGQWSLVVLPKVSGLVARIHGVPKLHGSWKGSRALDGWGVEDELRITDDAGNPIAYSHFVRVYDAKAKHWIVNAIDVYHQQSSTYTAQQQGNEMLSTAESVDADGKPYRTRTHITDITATGFHFSQDISHDGGATWDEAHLVMEAKRAPEPAPR